MYMGRKRGVGDVIPVPMSDWGFISPCSIAAATDQAADAGTTTSTPSPSLGTWAWLALIGGAIYFATSGGSK
jgi:hypothetical protein